MAKSNLTRREFIESTVAAGTAAAFAPHVSMAADSPLKTVRVGVVGIGERGIMLANTLSVLPGVVVNAVCDIDESRARKAQDVVEKATGQRPQAYTKSDRDWENLVARDDLDAVVNATPWELHTPISVAAMKAGKYAGTEVPAAVTIDECWELVRVSKQTGIPCMMLENVCWFRDVMAITSMVNQGLFGELIHCAGGYQHDVRFRWIIDGKQTWRGVHSEKKDGCLYPTHQAGPIAKWLHINRGDRFTQIVSLSTKSTGINHYAAEKVGKESELAKKTWSLGDINTALLKTANGKTVTLYHDCSLPRPYDLMFRVQGTKGVWMQDMGKIYLHGKSPKDEQWEEFAPYAKQYDDPMWQRHGDQAKKHGHDGADYLTLTAFVDAVRNRKPTPIDAVDSATWSAIHPLSVESVLKGAMIDFPDFSEGAWKHA